LWLAPRLYSWKISRVSSNSSVSSPSLKNITFQWVHRHRTGTVPGSVADPDPNLDPHDFGPPGSGSGSISQRYGSGSKK
jgi:hypothetical protein